MKTFFKSIVGVVFLLALMGAPALVLADTSGGPLPSNTTGNPLSSNATGCPANSSGSSFTLCNPLNVGTFCNLLKTIFTDILIIGIPIATLFIVIAGFRLVLARGNQAELQNAKRNLYYIVIGIALFLGAWTLAQIIAATLAQLGAAGGLC